MLWRQKSAMLINSSGIPLNTPMTDAASARSRNLALALSTAFSSARSTLARWIKPRLSSIVQRTGKPELDAKALALATAYGLPYIVGREVRGSTYAAAAGLGIPAVLERPNAHTRFAYQAKYKAAENTVQPNFVCDDRCQ